MMKNLKNFFAPAPLKSARHAPQKRSFLRTTPHKLSIIEVLMLISLFFVLSTLAIVTTNPSLHFAEARNAERWSQVNLLHNSLSVYQQAHHDALLEGTDIMREICRPHTDLSECRAAGLLSLSHLIPAYVAALPVDPHAEGARSGYAIALREEGGIIVTALLAEKGDSISVGR